MTPSLDDIRRRPKAVLHDHLDGGLRLSTVIELADGIRHRLPTTDESALDDWFLEMVDSNDLVRYLSTFEHTMAVMQTADQLHRVAHEAAVDLSSDGVVYAEVRYAPENHVFRELSLDDVVEAVQDGFRSGMASASSPIVVNTIICAMRQTERSREIADLAVRWRTSDPRVVAFDLAGPETGFPPRRHGDAILAALRGDLHLTIHASESPGLELILDALDHGAHRIGHGVRLLDDIAAVDGELVLGRVAQQILDRQIHLECCPTSNVQIGAVADIASHPTAAWHRCGFNVSVNTDNRLMSRVSVSSETFGLADAFDLTWEEIRDMNIAAINAGFGDPHERALIIDQIVRPGYAAPE